MNTLPYNLDELRLLRARGLRLNPEQFKMLKEASENERLQAQVAKNTPPPETTGTPPASEPPGTVLAMEEVPSDGDELKDDRIEPVAREPALEAEAALPFQEDSPAPETPRERKSRLQREKRQKMRVRQE